MQRPRPRAPGGTARRSSRSRRRFASCGAPLLLLFLGACGADGGAAPGGPFPAPNEAGPTPSGSSSSGATSNGSSSSGGETTADSGAGSGGDTGSSAGGDDAGSSDAPPVEDDAPATAPGSFRHPGVMINGDQIAFLKK